MHRFRGQLPNARSCSARLAAAAIIGLVALAPVAPAAAHSELIETTPASGARLAKAPTEVQLVFGEPVQAQGSSIVVSVRDTIVSKDSTFAAEENVATVQLVAAGQPGTYTVRFRVVSEDGHVVSDTFDYQVVGAAAPSSDETATDDASPAAATSGPEPGSESDGSSVVWVLGLGAIGLALVAAVISVAVRGRRDHTD